MKQTDLIAAEKSLRKVFGIALCRGDILVALLNKRTDDISLSALIKVFSDISESSRSQLARDIVGFNRLSAGRKLIEHGNIKVTVKHKRKRSRNGRCRHNECVRITALFAQSRPVLYSETVLFVCYNQSERTKFHIVLNESVSADYQIGFTVL